MKCLLHLVVVIVLASALQDIQQLVTRSLDSADDSNQVGGHSVSVLSTGVSAEPKTSKTSKLVFQILIDTRDFKKRRSGKRKGKKSLLRANRRKAITNRRKSNGRGRQKKPSNHHHKNHYHTLRKNYIKKLKGLFKHRNHYHKPKPKHDLFGRRYQRPFGRKDVTFKRRQHGRRKPSRRRPYKKHKTFLRNSRRSKHIRGGQDRRNRKTSFRQNNRRRRPTISRRSHWQRRHSSSPRNGKQRKKGWQAKETPRRKKVTKFTVIEFLFKNKKGKKPQWPKQNIQHSMYH